MTKTPPPGCPSCPPNLPNPLADCGTMRERIARLENDNQHTISRQREQAHHIAQINARDHQRDQWIIEVQSEARSAKGQSADALSQIASLMDLKEQWARWTWALRMAMGGLRLIATAVLVWAYLSGYLSVDGLKQLRPLLGLG